MSSLSPWVCPGCNYRWRVDPQRFPFNCANCGREALTYTPTPPALLERTFNLGRDTAKHLGSGQVLVTDVVREFRQSQCASCELFNQDLRVCTHKACGCFMRTDRGWFDALGWQTKICPIGRWDHPPTLEPLVFALYRKPGESQTSIGLGVNAQLTSSSLRQNGIGSLAVAVKDADEIQRLLTVYPSARVAVVEGFFLTAEALLLLAQRNPRVQFINRCHSQVAFLQIEPGSICRMRDVHTYSKTTPNLRLSGNSRRFTDFASEAWDGEVVHLPNLYPLPIFKPEPRQRGDRPLRLASFGALRLQKHHSVAAAAAAIVARRLGPVQFFINHGKGDPGANSVYESLEYLIGRSRDIELKPISWLHAAEFRRLTMSMDLCLQMSSSETFNLVTADAAANGIPSVVGEAIDWVPSDWRAPIDDPMAAAERAISVLGDATAGERGYAALLSYIASSVERWKAVCGEYATPSHESPAV